MDLTGSRKSTSVISSSGSIDEPIDGATILLLALVIETIYSDRDRSSSDQSESILTKKDRSVLLDVSEQHRQRGNPGKLQVRYREKGRRSVRGGGRHSSAWFGLIWRRPERGF
jgi:hypothetical protein